MTGIHNYNILCNKHFELSNFVYLHNVSYCVHSRVAYVTSLCFYYTVYPSLRIKKPLQEYVILVVINNSYMIGQSSVVHKIIVFFRITTKVCICNIASHRQRE